MNEAELLRTFRKDRSEEAFAELVRRYAGLVYSVAKRRLANVALVEDVTQIVFIRFAKTPPNVQTHGELAAWLHRTTLNVAIDTWRSETRRRNREQQAVVMESATQSAWEDISPNLDEAVNQLNDEDRQAVLLRFFGKKTMRDVGTALGVSEAAAKMRVSRAVDKLRARLSVGGAACTAAALGVLLIDHSVEAAPLPLVSRLTAMRMPKLAGATTAGGLLPALLRISKFKLAAGAAVLVLIGIGVVHYIRSAKVPAPVAALQVSSDTDAIPEAPVPRQITSSGTHPPSPSPKSPKIVLHVLDAETGFGLAQTKIKFFYFGAGGESESHETLTDDFGNASLRGPDDPAKNSSPNVYVTAEGHVPKLVSSTTNDFVIKLDPAIAVSGIVVDEHNVPVSGVEIFVDWVGGKLGQDVNFQAASATSHEDGSWSCSYIPKDSTNDFHLLLKKADYAMTLAFIPVPFAYSGYLILVMDSGTLYTGKITDEQNRPIANARIKVLASDLRKRESTYTDENGIFTLRGIKADGTWTGSQFETNTSGGLIIRPQSRDKILKTWKGMPGILPQLIEANLSVQAEGFAPQLKTIQLTNDSRVINFTLSPGNFFRGRVVDDLGNPIPNAVVQTDYYSRVGGREFDWTAHTDANGMFQWDSAPPGETAYWIEADGYDVLRRVFLAADNTDHEITLKRIGAEQ